MNYITLLTSEEKTNLCEIITGRRFKGLFVHNEQQFSKIQKGFRAKSLTEQRALSIAMVNVDKPFIASWINQRVDSWLKEIQENIEKLKDEGKSYDTALATTMLDSVFADNVNLYLKLTEADADTNAGDRLRERMESVKSNRVRNAKVEEKVRSLEEENRRLSAQLETTQQSIDAMKVEYECQISKMEQDNLASKELLMKAQEQIAELQAPSVDAKVDDAEYLASFDDVDPSLLPPVDSDETVSLCEVITDYNGQKMLTRCADLNHDGKYSIFRRDTSIAPYFTNRDRIFCKDISFDDGFYGVWNWSAVPSEKDASKDYVLSQYHVGIHAIEVVVTEAVDLGGLIGLLKNGIEYQMHSRKVMFSVYISKGQYVGILCNAKDLKLSNGTISFSEHCNVVPIYEFSDNDIMRCNHGFSFYRSAFAGMPNKLCHLKSSIEIVKDIVFSSTSWTAYKARGMSRAAYSKFKDFLSDIPVNDIVSQIEVSCRCSNSDAKELLDEFLTVAWKYIDGDTLNDKIILSAISANADLQEKTKTLIREEWELENKKLLDEAQQEWEARDAELKDVTVRINEAEELLRRTRMEEERLRNTIAEKEILAEDVEKAVAERIQTAREHAADFIANMAFVSGQSVHNTTVDSLAVGTESHQPVPYDMVPAVENLDDLEPHHSWADVIETAAFEFGEAGVAESYRRGLAAFLCAAYIEKQPILLVGPNAVEIVRAFSAAVAAQKHGILFCEGSELHQAVKGIGSDGEDIVIIHNLITSGCINRLPEILSQKDIFYIIVHPYAEDIQVEPKSLYGFMLPLFTEFFVDRRATGNYYGGYFADDFKPYSVSQETHYDVKFLSKLTLNSFVKNQINSLIGTMHGIYPDTTLDDEFLFAALPIAYATMTMNELAEIMVDSQTGATISAGLKRDLQFVFGDVR